MLVNRERRGGQEGTGQRARIKSTTNDFGFLFQAGRPSLMPREGDKIHIQGPTLRQLEREELERGIEGPRNRARKGRFSLKSLRGSQIDACVMTMNESKPGAVTWVAAGLSHSGENEVVVKGEAP